MSYGACGLRSHSAPIQLHLQLIPVDGRTSRFCPEPALRRGEAWQIQMGNPLLSLWLWRANRCMPHAVGQAEMGTDFTKRSSVVVPFSLGTT